MEKSKSLMQSQLLASLRASIQLPACLRVVGFLRRMETFSPTELRLRFLQARDTWLTSVLSAIPRDDRKLMNGVHEHLDLWPSTTQRKMSRLQCDSSPCSSLLSYLCTCYCTCTLWEVRVTTPGSHSLARLFYV